MRPKSCRESSWRLKWATDRTDNLLFFSSCNLSSGLATPGSNFVVRQSSSIPLPDHSLQCLTVAFLTKGRSFTSLQLEHNCRGTVQDKEARSLAGCLLDLPVLVVASLRHRLYGVLFSDWVFDSFTQTVVKPTST